MTQEELNNKIAELEKQIAELKQVKVEEPKRWKPKEGKLFWSINVYGELECENYDDVYCRYSYITGNCFKTKEEAMEYKAKLEIRAKYKNYIEEHSEPLDWKNREQEKYVYMYDCGDKVYEVVGWEWYRLAGTIYASSKEIIEQAIDYIGGEEVAIKYLFD